MGKTIQQQEKLERIHQTLRRSDILSHFYIQYKNNNCLNLKLHILLIIELAFASSLFFLFYPNILDVVNTGYIPSQVTFNMIYSSLLESNFNSIIYLISLISGKYDILLSDLIIFLIGYFSMFYAILYFSGKYTKANKIFSYIIATIFSFIYLAYPFFGTGFYVVFDSFFPLVIVLFDKFFTEYYSKPKNSMIGGIFVMTAITSLAITDFRTIIYIPFMFIVFFMYYNIIEHSFKYFKQTLYMTLYAAIFLIAFELRFFISIYLISHVGITALGSTVSLQLNLAYTSFPLLNSIAGNIQWYTTYRQGLIYLALLPFLLIVISMRLSKGLRILRFMFLLLLTIILFDTYGGKAINYTLGQTALYSYLPILFPTDLIAVLYYPLLLITSGFSLSIIIDRIIHANKGKQEPVIKIASLKGRIKRSTPLFLSIIVVIMLSTSQIYYLEASVKDNRNKVFYDIVPPPLEKAFNYLNAHNVSGHIIELGNFSNSYYNYSYWPPNTFPTGGWGANWYPHPVDYFMEHNISNLANLLKYMGVQYLMYRFSNSTSLSYLESQSKMNLIFHDSSIYLFQNQNYTAQIQSNSLYAVYNLPESMSVLSQLNKTYPLIPFYDLLQMQNPLQYISGIIGYNLSGYKLEPLFLNKSNSYFDDVGSMNVNNLDGWQQMPVINSGDEINALAPDTASTLNLQLNIPSGKYQLLLVGGVSPVPTAPWNFQPYSFAASALLKIYSNSSANYIVINQSNFSPYLNVYEVNNFSYFGGNINIKSFGDTGGTPFISYIYFIPKSKIASITQDINKYLKEANIVDYNGALENNSVIYPNDNKTANIPFPLSVHIQNTGYTTKFNVVISYKDSDIAAFSYVQDATLKGEVFHSAYFYGSGFVYISSIANTTLVYGNYSGQNLIIMNIISIALVTLYTYIPLYLKRRRVK